MIELRGYNDLFNPYYGEDVDLGLRAWRLGYKCYYENKAVCRHPTSATINKEPSEKIRIVSKRNKMYLHFIHLNNLELFCYLFTLIVKMFLKTLMFDLKYLKSFWLFLNSINECIKSKKRFRELQKSKNVELSVNDIVKIIKENIKSTAIERF